MPVSYTNIPNGDTDPDSPLTTGLVTLLRDNPISMIEGGAGAPRILNAALNNHPWDTADIAAAAIGRSQLANSTTTSAGTVSNGSSISITLNDWALFPMIHMQQSGGQLSFLAGNETDGGSASSPRFTLVNNDGANKTYDVDHRWIIAA